MAISYKKLWKLLIDREMTRTELRKLSGISSATLAKLGKNQNVNTESIAKICGILRCNIEDIMEIAEEGVDDEEA